MNIFYLDHDPAVAARYHCDKHVIKMILESAQLLCTAINYHAGKQVTPYKSTHVSHPCSIWVRESFENWSYVYQLMFDLEFEWRYRWQHTKKHSSVVALSGTNITALAIAHIPAGQLTTPALAMPTLYQIPNDPVESYRTYYRISKHNLLQYTRRERPEWLTAQNFKHYQHLNSM